ncbi:hypothetical protein E2320_014306 [Naja naja]|nr:hypothetical protein E2320_014306 [Naja naja]
MEGVSRPRQGESIMKMLGPVMFQAVPLLLCDRILLSLLADWGPSMIPLGVTAAWLEAALRLVVLWGARGLLSVGGTFPVSSSSVAAVSILPPLYLLVGPWLGDPPLLVSSAAWSWWLAIYGAVGFSWLLWGILAEGQSTKESQKEEDKATLWKMLRLFGPDKLYLSGAFLFLILALSLCQLPWQSLLVHHLSDDHPDSQLAVLFSGALTSRLSNDTVKMSRSVPLNTNVFLRNLIKAIGLYIFMIGLSWRLTLLMLIETPLMMAVQKVYNVRHQALLKAIQDSMARSGEVVQEVISSVQTVRSFATEEKEAQRYEASLEDTCRLKNQRDLERIVYGFAIHNGLMTKGNLVSFILYQANVGWYVQALIYTYGDALSNVGAAEKVFEYLDREPSVRTEGTLSKESLRGHVSFQNLLPGKVTALVGPNGSGKSSCVALLEHFYEPQSGEVLLDGVPVGEYEHKYLHRQVALVGQEPVLFSGSIRENITYGLQDCSEEDVSRAAEEADALGFIRELEGGFDAEVGEKGDQLSIGQKQRLAIARALIRDPKVLVLDEATSALDPESDAAIQRLVQKHGDRTVLVIAHRMQTVENADKTIVLEGGEVVEEGTHPELMGRGGPYYRLVERTQAE